MTVLRGIRIALLVSLFLLNGIMMVINGLVIGSGKMSISEPFHCAMDMISILVIITTVIYKLTHHDAEPVNIPNIICFGSLWLASFGGSIALTLRAPSSPGICDDFSVVDGSCKLASAAIALSWITTITALAGSFVAVHDKHPGAIELVSFNTRMPSVAQPPPARKRSHGYHDTERFSDAAAAVNDNYNNPSTSSLTNLVQPTVGSNDKKSKSKSTFREGDPETYAYWGSGWFDEDENRKGFKYPPRAKTWMKTKRNKHKAPSTQFTELKQTRRARRGGEAHPAAASDDPSKSGWY